jgi:transposase
MSSTELRRVEVFARVKSGELQLCDAAVLLDISYRHAKRLWRRYRRQGAAGLKHRSAGKRSNRAKPEKFRRKVLRLIREKYSATDAGERFGPTLAAEHLASEDGLEVAAETLRRWMLAAGLWTRERKRKPYLQRRQRRHHFGELVQLDGSFHEWLEKRGPRACLMNMVDDATGTTLAMFCEQETIWAAVRILRAWIESYGVPRALYTDWKNVYKRKPTEQECVDGTVPVTQFGRMCARLGIVIIAASSPQAKGRVERNHGTHQDRLVKKLRLKRIDDYAAANEFLGNTYLAEHNERFTQQPAEAADYHQRAPGKKELDRIFRLEHERTISNDWVIRHDGRWYQLQRQSQNYAPVKAKVTLYQSETGQLEIQYRGRKLSHSEITGPPVGKPAKAKQSATKRQYRHAPTQEHPWRQGYSGMKPRAETDAADGRLLQVFSIASR